MTVAHRHYAVVIALLAVTVAAVILEPGVSLGPQAGIIAQLPEHVGEYEGADLLFCLNEHCTRSFSGMSVTGAEVCETCGGGLGTMSVAEKSVLPEDTVIVRKRYTHSAYPPITVSIVFSGSEQRSIHRPQQCLPAQGAVIERDATVSIPLEGRRPLKVMLLDMRSGPGPGGRRGGLSCYAYWFVGIERETPYHLQRLFWMASDRVFHGVSHRWAYVSLATAKTRKDSDEHIDRVTKFISEFYPLIHPWP